MKRRTNAARGSALLTVMILTAVVLSLTAALLVFTGQEQRRAINLARGVPRNYCTDTGLQLARAYFGRNFASWNTYLADATHYNPVKLPSPYTDTPADPNDTTLQSGKPELFADLDGDGKLDVYIYIRDNMDELPPATTNNPKADNDLQVIVGAVCISQTLAPHLANGKVDPALMTEEALLSYNGASGTIAQRCGANGSSLGNCDVN